MSTRAKFSSSGHRLWVVVLAAAAIAAIGMGLRNVIGLYMAPMSMELDIGREVFSLSVAIANIVWGLMAPFAGAAADRYGAGRVVATGGVATCAGLLMLWQGTSAAELYAAGVLLGLGIAGAGSSVMVGVVGRAAGPHELSRALAGVSLGAGIGILLALPLTHLLMDVLGWRASLFALSLVALLVLPLAFAVNGRPGPGHEGAGQSAGEALAEAFAHRGFWLLNAGFFVCGFHVVFYATHLPAYVADQGLQPGVAVMALMAVGIGNLIGTWAAGEWGRRRPKRYGLAAIYALRAVVFLAFLWVPVTPAMIVALSGALGLLWLATIPLTSGIVGSIFGGQWMTMLYGFVFLSHQAGSFLGAWAGGVAFDSLKSYDAMWWISAALGLLAAFLSLPISEKPLKRLAQGAAA